MAKILHVEDDQVWIDIVRESLGEHRVDSARSQTEAVRLLLDSAEPYDVALIDFELGDAGGAGGELLDLLKWRYPNVQPVVLTGRIPGGALFAGVFDRYKVFDLLAKQDFDAARLRRVVEAASASTMDDGQPSMRPPAVFISYGDWSDRTYAMRLRQYLIDEGLRVW